MATTPLKHTLHLGVIQFDNQIVRLKIVIRKSLRIFVVINGKTKIL